MLSRVMLKHPNFLLLDDPTNHLDLESIIKLNDSLVEFPGNLIMTSHDHHLMQTVCNRIIDINPGSHADHLGTYEEYLNIAAKRRAVPA